VKALVVLTQPPMLEGGAPGKVAIGLLRGLIRHGVEVQALAARSHFAVAGEVPADLPVEVLPIDPPSPWRARIDRIRRPRGELATNEFLARVRELGRDADVIHLEETETAWCDLGLATPSLVHIHYRVRRDRALGAPWRGQFTDVLEFAAGERAAIRRHRHLVASSPLVAAELRREAPRAEVVLAPLSLDPAGYEPASLEAPVAGIIGTAGWPPTASAMHELVERIWQLVRRRAPEARLVVGGRGVDDLGLVAGAGTEVLGAVPSAREFVRGLGVLLFPLRRGSGVKVKVLEAIASGVPVVTTPAGAEGVDAPGAVFVEHDWERFADRAAELLLDEEARRAAGTAARRAFGERYAPEPATRPLVELYQRMLKA
jgi:glycosyltransferase involved in cell wall biosynthesis